MSLLSKIKTTAVSYWSSLTTGQRIATAGLTLLWVALLVFLIDGDKPWNPEIRERIAAATEAGKRWKMKDFIATGLWWASLFNVFMVSGLLVTVRWWLHPISLEQPTDRSSLADKGSRRWFIGLVLAAVVVAGTLAAPRMSLSFWGDEEHSMRQCVIGKYKVNDEGALQFRPLELSDNLWMYYGPNNHFLFTLLARSSLEVWKATCYDGGLPFSEVAARLPSYIAGLAAIVAVAFLFRALGFARAGIIAAWFMAIHPWHLKYTAEARGYALVLLFASLGLLALTHALRSGKWRWWALFGLSEFCMLYAYPAALYLAVTQNLAALALIALLFGLRREALQQTTRWLVVNLFAAMATIQLLAPTVPQMQLWLARDRAKADLGFPWIQDFWGFLTTGMSWNVWDANNPLCQTVSALRETTPVHYWLVLILIPLLIIIGLIRMAFRGRISAGIAVAMLTAAPLGFLHAQSNGSILYVWYLIYALPAYVGFVAVGLETLTLPFARSTKTSNIATIAVAVVFLGWFWSMSNEQRTTLRTHAIEPQRDSVLATRPVLDPFDPLNEKITTVEFVFNTPLYDPRAIAVDEGQPGADQLTQLMATAKSANTPLFVNFGSEGWARHSFPELFLLLDDPTQFEVLKRFWGLDQQNTRVVYRYIGGATEASGL